MCYSVVHEGVLPILAAPIENEGLVASACKQPPLDMHLSEFWGECVQATAAGHAQQRPGMGSAIASQPRIMPVGDEPCTGS